MRAIAVNGKRNPSCDRSVFDSYLARKLRIDRKGVGVEASILAFGNMLREGFQYLDRAGSRIVFEHFLGSEWPVATDAC